MLSPGHGPTDWRKRRATRARQWLSGGEAWRLLSTGPALPALPSAPTRRRSIRSSWTSPPTRLSAGRSCFYCHRELWGSVECVVPCRTRDLKDGNHRISSWTALWCNRCIGTSSFSEWLLNLLRACSSFCVARLSYLCFALMSNTVVSLRILRRWLPNLNQLLGGKWIKT